MDYFSRSTNQTKHVFFLLSHRSHDGARFVDLFLNDGDNVYSFIVWSHEYNLVRFIMADLFNVLIFSSPDGGIIVDDG